jgi:hypothetical protein
MKSKMTTDPTPNQTALLHFLQTEAMSQFRVWAGQIRWPHAAQVAVDGLPQ